MYQESSPCIICNDCNTEKISKEGSYTHGDIYFCKDCQLRFINPLPNDKILKQAYDGLYSNREIFDKIDIHKRDITRKAFSGYLSKINKLNLGPYKSFLDVGGGLGYYSEAAQYNNLTSTLLDIDKQSIEFAKDKNKIHNIYNINLDEFVNNIKLKFDIVFFRHVIEHVTDPDSIISNLEKCLNPNGLLIIETPNNNSIELIFRPRILLSTFRNHKKKYPQDSLFKFIRKKIYAVRPPYHLYSFRISNLEKLMITNGLNPVSSVNYMIGDKTYWPNSSKTDIAFVMKYLTKLKLKLFFISAIDVIFYPFRLIFHHFGFSCGICIYAQKNRMEDEP